MCAQTVGRRLKGLNDRSENLDRGFSSKPIMFPWILSLLKWELVKVAVLSGDKQTLRRPPSGVHPCRGLPPAGFLHMSDQKVCVYTTERSLNFWSHGNQMSLNWRLLVSHQNIWPVCAGLFLCFYLSDEFSSCFVILYECFPARHNVAFLACCARVWDISELNGGCQSPPEPNSRFLGREDI